MRAMLFDIRLGDEARRWAVPCGAIVEVLPVVAWRPIPGGPSWALGLFERKRMLLPLIDLSLKLGGPAVAPRIGSRILVMRIAPERKDGGLGGLLLESTLGLDTIDWEADGGHAGFACALDSPFGPVTTHAGTTVQLLHVERLLTQDERNLVLPEPSIAEIR
jgi:chemotaxis signal transduction protein